MKKVYIVHRYVSYKYPNNSIEDVANSVDRVFDTKEKAVNYIRKEIVWWHDNVVNRGQPVESIVDETQQSCSGMRAYFMGRDGDAIVFRNLYYEICDVK